MQFDDPTGVAWSQHYITGSCEGIDDTSLAGLAQLYGTTWQQIADINFGGHTVNQIYNWLSTHGGRKQTPYAGHSSGWNWSFAPGMVASVPGPVTKSPEPASGGIQVGDPNAPESQPPAPPSQDVVSTPPADVGMGPVEEGGYQGAAVGGSLTWILLVGAAIGIVIMLKKGKKGKSGKGSKRRGRRRNPCSQQLGVCMFFPILTISNQEYVCFFQS